MFWRYIIFPTHGTRAQHNPTILKCSLGPWITLVRVPERPGPHTDEAVTILFYLLNKSNNNNRITNVMQARIFIHLARAPHYDTNYRLGSETHHGPSQERLSITRSVHAGSAWFAVSGLNIHIFTNSQKASESEIQKLAALSRHFCISWFLWLWYIVG